MTNTNRNNKIESFWKWFKEVAGESELRKDSPLLLDVRYMLHQIDRNVDFQIDWLEETISDWLIEHGKSELTISANGCEEYSEVVEAIVSKAPSIDGWDIVAFRQPKPSVDGWFGDISIFDEDVEFAGVTRNKNKYDITVYIKDYEIEEDATFRYGLLQLLCDHIGEYTIFTKLNTITIVEADCLLKGQPLSHLHKYI